jgi:HSP20 family protein
MADVASVPTRDRAEPARPEQTRGGVAFTPRVDIFETETELLLYAEVPGVKPDGVNLRYENGELTLHARVTPRLPRQGFLLREYDEGDFCRTFAIHESIDAGRIEAECKNGVLLVHLPKSEAVRPRQIQVTGGA